MWICILCYLITPSALAKQINWRCITNRINITSDGIPLDKSVVFELGSFSDGFEPSANNQEHWASHWVMVDRTVYRENDRAFSSSYVVQPDDPMTPVGRKAYIWGYSTEGDHGEWLLVRKASWSWPIPAPLSLPLSWVISGDLIALSGVIGGAGEAFYMKTGAVRETVKPPAVLPDRWMVAQGLAGWLDDPDGDGLSNMIEYALGSDPNKWTTSDLALKIDQITEETAVVCFTKRPDRLVRFELEHSKDLDDWKLINDGDFTGTLSVNDDVHQMRVEKTIVELTQEFYQVRVRWLE